MLRRRVLPRKSPRRRPFLFVRDDQGFYRSRRRHRPPPHRRRPRQPQQQQNRHTPCRWRGKRNGPTPPRRTTQRRNRTRDETAAGHAVRAAVPTGVFFQGSEMLLFLSRHASSCGVVVCFLDFCGIDYDSLVTGLLKGFPIDHDIDDRVGGGTRRQTSKSRSRSKKTTTTDADVQKRRTRRLIQKLRHRPCPALLSLLHRRILRSQSTRTVVSSRIKRCERADALLFAHPCRCPNVGRPVVRDGGGGGGDGRNLRWLYPILVDRPGDVSRGMGTTFPGGCRSWIAWRRFWTVVGQRRRGSRW